MLESVAARLLNQLLGKYVVDLDTENLNVGIFSGQVQLKDLQLKAEALYELQLPIKVKVGTIGHVWLKIPWNYLWNDPIIVNVEDILIVAEPIINSESFDPEIDKRLVRALKKKLISYLENRKEYIGGPNSFSEHFLTNLINHIQLNVSNIHIRYEDDFSANTPLACGLCISSITAETTNSKWKACKLANNAEQAHYLIKVEALSAYWNPNHKLRRWKIPAQYYAWRNAMSNSLQNFSMFDEEFQFVVKPMTTKVKMTIHRTHDGDISSILSDIVIQDCNIQLTQKQYSSMLAVHSSMSRMLISWNFLHIRPKEGILKNKKAWWKYAYEALLEQRIRPYTWSKIKKVRKEYKQYTELYKKFLQKSNDTELKLDLQKFEDCLSIVNIVIARKQATLIIQENSSSDKTFWAMLPSPERVELCNKIGFSEDKINCKCVLEQKHCFRMSSFVLTMKNNGREIFLLTMTQVIWSILPNLKDNTYKAVFKIEGIVVEGASLKDHLTPILSSQHNPDNPAYFLKIEVEKMPLKSNISYKVSGCLGAIEIIYQEYAFRELNKFLREKCIFEKVYKLKNFSTKFIDLIEDKLSKKWYFNFDIAVPYVVFSDSVKIQKGDDVFLIDFGRLMIRTELCEKIDVLDTTTQMELEEQFYSRLHVELKDIQVLFGDIGDSWKEAKKEKNTSAHLLSKTNLSATFASCVKTIKTIPKYKFNTTLFSVKLNISERKLIRLSKLLNNLINHNLSNFQHIRSKENKFNDDIIPIIFTNIYLRHVNEAVKINSIIMAGSRRSSKVDKNGIITLSKEKKTIEDSQKKENMNEAWARVVDLPGLEDNISPSNNISVLLRLIINEFIIIYSRSSDVADRAYLMLRLGTLVIDVALMNYGPAYQISLNSVLLTDKLYTNSSGQYLDLIYSPFPSKLDVLTVLYRKVDANCPDFWTHFHGVETSLVADIGTLNLLLHQDALHTLVKYWRYILHKIESEISPVVKDVFKGVSTCIQNLLPKMPETPVPPGAVKFSHSARLTDLKIRVCDADFDIINVEFSGLEMDFLFRANERFVFRSFLSTLVVEHLSDMTLYPKVISTDEDKVFEIKYVRHAPHLFQNNEISPSHEDLDTDGSFKFQLGRIHVTFLYKLIVQLQRFIVNMEAVSLIQSVGSYFETALSKATDTLKASTKIHLAVNIRGPILLFPQRSDSPNVVIFDTGELNIENFFKEYSYETVENILVKLNNFTVSRGVMTLTSNLELQFQETMVEPVGVHLDIKRFISHSKPSQKHLTWDIDGAIDTVQVTLGQRDLSVILAIYVDNIGEGKLIDLIPEVVKSPTDQMEIDNTVRTLEAFFCEPKQKDVSIKFAIDSVKLLLFFDSGELLSSPVRDLNHGLCKFEMSELFTSSIVYTDRSIDGKLSVNAIFMEELGLDINNHDKGILHSPVDNNRNNNCNITVNKPPVIDITFHQNKSKDKSIDVIVGRLSLCLSVPFCEKIALFILECLPKESVDVGIINHGYIGDISDNLDVTTSSPSLTVALRINKPEFIFSVETTSNKKRYFLTKTEILSDYSRHNNRLNLAISLSGFHSLFYDLGLNSSVPYVVLKKCDVEFAKSCCDEKGEKITMTISSVCFQLCSRVVHSFNDILNDIIEHFKVPEIPLDMRRTSTTEKPTEHVDTWECKKMNEFLYNTHNNEPKLILSDKVHEILLVPKTEIVLILELEETPVIILKTTLEMTAYDWSSLLSSTCEFTIQANYYNNDLQIWEPFIDPVVINENEYVPWDILIKIFQDKSLPILNTVESNKSKKDAHFKVRKKSPSVSSTEDEESKEEMVFLEPPKTFYNLKNRGIKTSLSTFLDESDSENDEGAMEKLASAISDLFTGDWNESEVSDCDEHSSEADEESTEENLGTKSEETTNETPKNFKKSTYFIFEAKESLNITVSPNLLKILNEIFTMYSSKTLSISANTTSINLINDIGPKTVVDLFGSKNGDEIDTNVLVHSRTYENEDSCPNSPSKNSYLISEYIDETNDDADSFTEELLKLEVDLSYDYDTTDSLQFPLVNTKTLYEKIRRHYLKIHVPGFSTLQTNCPKKTWQKFMRLQSNEDGQSYYLIAKHSIGKQGRTIIVSSPLQIKNKTCFALSILYEPSVLQQLNLEPLGDVTNPFETTMRIAVLEPHEKYNVPLYIAYHCKLFIQPAYAEEHYVSNEGLWWKDLATELDVPHYITCKPKSKSNLEVFALRVKLNKNVLVNNSRSHSIPNFVINLLPPVTLQNFLPYALEVQNIELKQHIKVEPGEKSSIYSLNLEKDQKFLLKISYSNMVWTGALTLTPNLDEKIVTLSTDKKMNNISKQLSINVKVEQENSYNVLFYASYWIINKTELPLQIKSSTSNVYHEIDNEDVLLFTFKKHSKQSITLKVYESSWSNDFGLDCAGTTGLVVCKDHERKKRYSFLLSIQLSQMTPQYTKLITFLPAFVIVNNTKKFLRFMENNEKTDLWIDLPPQQYKIFWPETSSMQMFVKYRESKLASQAFFISSNHHTVLRMDKGSALSVDVTGGTTASFYVAFNDYKPGDAPVMIKNMCADLFLKIQQNGQGQVTLLNPYTSLMYTWDDPIKPRQFLWNIYNNKGPGFFIDIFKDGFGEEKINFHSVNTTNIIVNKNEEVESSTSEDSDTIDSVKTTLNRKVRRDKITIYWTCYNEGLQKVLLFTQEQRIFNLIMKNIFTKLCDFEYICSLSGIGISLFGNNPSNKELAHFSISDAPAIWEVNVGHKWKTLTLELASWIESKYRFHYKKCQLKDYIHIDFEKMFMLKPFFAELRRSYNPAFYFLYRRSRDFHYINLKLQNLQIDNKQSSKHESILLCPIPPISIKSNTPLFEITAFKHSFENCAIYKHIYINIEEFQLHLDLDFIQHIGELITDSLKLKDDLVSLYRAEMALIHTPLVNTSNRKTVSYTTKIENLRLSQISIQLSISSKNHADFRKNAWLFGVLVNYIFPVNYSAYMPAEGIRHRLILLDLANVKSKLSEALYHIWQCTRQQFLQQYYSQVLGLQVLVNSFTVQPIPSNEIIINDSERAASILLLGFRCLLGHLNMSPAALEQCATEIFCNQSMESIQRIRRHGSYHKSATIPKSIAVSSKNFETGVTLALEQIIKGNIHKGMHYDGEVFFKGTGKALFSLLTRHPDDKSDTVQIAIEAIRRASLLGEPVRIHQRLTRYLNSYLGIRPFSVYESMGHYLLETVAGGKFLEDTYWAHATIDKNEKSIILISLEHVMRLNKCRLWGPWELEWILGLDEVLSVPQLDASAELILNIRQDDKFTNSSNRKLSIVGDREMLMWIKEKIEQAIVVSMEDKSWVVND